MSPIFPQGLLDLHDELIVDLFAGGGGASCGIEMATGRQVDVAINHDAAAVSMHEANHPQTRHFQSDVFEVDPRDVTRGRAVGLLWASPDCTYHSKASGAKPIRHKNRKRRALAWVVTRWAGQVRPRVIMLENVEEFADWGPLVGPPDALRPCPRRRGRTFRKWVRSLERLGYTVEWRELRAHDYGAPTIRKRLFLVARCDGEPIEWPTPTHEPGTRKPYRSAAECIDWSIPMLSIFATREEATEWARAHRAAGRKIGTPVRPLAEATMRRIAHGVMRYVVEAVEPFIVGGGAKHAPVSAFLAKHFTGVVGSDLREPKGTVTTIDHDALVTVRLSSEGGGRARQVAAFIQSYYGTDQDAALSEPLATITTKDRHALVTVEVSGEPYVIADIAMRMLQPHELYRAQGFPDSYIIDRGADGRRLTKTEQIRMVGNSVVPQLAAALVRANVPELIARDEARGAA